jgi:DNA-directed RNA polymerase specialized sigma24 family protein
MVSDLTETVAAARKYNGSALVTLLEFHAPRVQRLAMGLCGQPRTGRKVTRIVMRQALAALPKLRDADSVDRWFTHRTVLETRQHTGQTSAEVLRDSSPRRDPPYLAFVQAFRVLPIQQREALLLTHGEHLNPRYVGVAMDCSADAAANHLRAATQHLQAIAGGQFPELLAALAQAYQQLAPPPQVARRDVRRHVSHFLLPRRLRRFVILLILLAIAYAAWHWRAKIRSILP